MNIYKSNEILSFERLSPSITLSTFLFRNEKKSLLILFEIVRSSIFSQSAGRVVIYIKDEENYIYEVQRQLRSYGMDIKTWKNIVSVNKNSELGQQKIKKQISPDGFSMEILDDSNSIKIDLKLEIFNSNRIGINIS